MDTLVHWCTPTPRAAGPSLYFPPGRGLFRPSACTPRSQAADVLHMASSCTAVEEAVLLSCDIPTRQYILHVDQEQQRELKKESFVIRQLDPTHLYVKAQVCPDTRHGAR